MTFTCRPAVLTLFAALVFGAAGDALAQGKKPQAAAQKNAPPQGARVGIATVVNDDIITFSDIEDRVRLYMLGAPPNLPEEARQRVLHQALYRLVDEKLQLQEAKALNIVVSDSEIAQGFAHIARQNNLEPDDFGAELRRAGINLETIQEQIRAEIAWTHVVRRKLRPQVAISESEIDTEVDRLKRSSGRTEYRIAEIFLSFDGAASEKNAFELAERLSGDIRKGRPFSQIAREHSEAPGAATGGDLGWIEEGTLPADLDRAVAALQPGQLSAPVRTDKGYHLLFLRDVRQKGLPSAAAAATAAPASAAPQNRPSLVSTNAPVPRGAEDQADPAVIEPVAATGGAISAEAAAATASEAEREEIASRLGMQRLEQMAERYLRDLRATAFIEQRF